MKKAVLLLLIAPFLIFSCKKEKASAVKPVQKTFKVSFSVSGFTQTIASIKSRRLLSENLVADTSTSNIGAYATVLHLTIFNSNGVLIRRLEQISSTVSNFGFIADTLAAGTYTVVVDAGQQFLKLSQSNLFYLNTGNGSDIRPNEGIWSDSFFSKFQLTVSNSAINQAVNLNRIVSKLEVDFNDIIPQNAVRVDLFLNKEDFEYSLYLAQPQTADTVTTHYTVPDSVKGTSNFKLSQIVLNTLTPFNVTLTAYDASNNVIATHAVANVSCQSNKRTVLTGNFSNTIPNTNKGFSITLDPNWGTPTTVHY